MNGRIPLSAVLIGLVLTEGACHPQEAETDPPVIVSNSSVQQDSARTDDHFLTEVQNTSKRLQETWLKTLREGQYAQVEFRSERTMTSRLLTEPSSTAREVSKVTVEAKAVMEPDALWLVGFDDDLGQQRQAGKPAIVLSFVDGQITERLWYPAFQQYRTTKYPAPSRFGANNTEYEHGCQVGLLLQTWLGEAEILNMFERGFSIAQIRPEPTVVNGSRCSEFYFDLDPHIDPYVDIGREKRVGAYFLDERGLLKRTTQRATLVKDDSVIEIIAVDDYDFTFLEEKPVHRSAIEESAGKLKVPMNNYEQQVPIWTEKTDARVLRATDLIWG